MTPYGGTGCKDIQAGKAPSVRASPVCCLDMSLPICVIYVTMYHRHAWRWRDFRGVRSLILDPIAAQWTRGTGGLGIPSV